MDGTVDDNGNGDSRKQLKSRLPKSDRRAQAAVMMMQRLTEDVTTRELADAYGMSERTVERRLKDARLDNSISRHVHAVIIQELLPRSLVVLRDALEGDDKKLAVQVALKMIDGLKVLATPPTDDTSPPPGQEDSLEVWRARLTRRSARTTADAVIPDTIDTTAVAVADGDAPPDEAAHSSQPPEAGPSASPSVPLRAEAGEPATPQAASHPKGAGEGGSEGSL